MKVFVILRTNDNVWSEAENLRRVVLVTALLAPLSLGLCITIVDCHAIVLQQKIYVCIELHLSSFTQQQQQPATLADVVLLIRKVQVNARYPETDNRITPSVRQEVPSSVETQFP